MGRWLGVKDDLWDEGKGVCPLKVPVPGVVDLAKEATAIMLCHDI